MANKEHSNNVDSRNIESSVYNKDRIIFDKEKSSKQSLTNDENNDYVETVETSKPIKCDKYKNKNELLLTCDNEINNCNCYKDNNRQHKERYIE